MFKNDSFLSWPEFMPAERAEYQFLAPAFYDSPLLAKLAMLESLALEILHFFSPYWLSIYIITEFKAYGKLLNQLLFISN